MLKLLIPFLLIAACEKTSNPLPSSTIHLSRTTGVLETGPCKAILANATGMSYQSTETSDQVTGVTTKKNASVVELVENEMRLCEGHSRTRTMPTSSPGTSHWLSTSYALVDKHTGHLIFNKVWGRDIPDDDKFVFGENHRHVLTTLPSKEDQTIMIIFEKEQSKYCMEGVIHTFEAVTGKYRRRFRGKATIANCDNSQAVYELDEDWKDYDASQVQ